MKFSCTQNVLTKSLNIVTKAVTSRTTIPVLKGILLKVSEDGILKMSASDLDLTIENKFEVENFEPGETVVPAKLFGDIIRKLPNDVITIEEENNNNIIITCSNSKFTVVGFSSEEFPIIKEDNDKENIILNKELIKDMIRKTSFCASIDEGKKILTGILFEIEEDGLNMVSSDGFRMAVSRANLKSDLNKKIIIPQRILNEIGKIISEVEDDSSDISLYMSEKRALFIIGNVKVYLRLLEGEFIKYKNYIPENNNIKVLINRDELLESIERASLLARIKKNNLIKLDFTGTTLEITSNSEEGNVKETILIRKENEDITIGFNSKYLIDVLKAIDDEEILMLFEKNNKPCLIRPTEGNAYDYLVFPIRIQG